MTYNEVIFNQIVDMNNSIKGIVLNLQPQHESFLHRWQELLGAFIGVFSAFLIWYISRIFERKNKKREELFYIYNILTSQIKILGELKITSERFLNHKLPDFILQLKNSKLTGYSISRTFFPISNYIPIENRIINIDTSIGYLNAKIGLVYDNSRVFSTVIKNVEEQLDHTFEINRDIVINKLSEAADQNEDYINNLNNYNKEMRKYIFININIFIDSLTETILAIETLQDLGIFRWNLKFSKKYSFIRGNLSKNNEDVFLVVKKYLEKQQEILIRNFNNSFSYRK